MIKETLKKLNLSQTDLAQLLEVTNRTVNLWAMEQREVPGPVKAYLRVVEILSPTERQKEFSRLSKEKDIMREGFYGIQFQGSKDFGVGALIFEKGQVYGVDIGAGKYDGTYFYEPKNDTINADIKVTIPPGVETVMGICNPYEWSFDVSVSMPAQGDTHLVHISAFGNKIAATISYLRPLPTKQAA